MLFRSSLVDRHAVSNPAAVRLPRVAGFLPVRRRARVHSPVGRRLCPFPLVSVQLSAGRERVPVPGAVRQCVLACALFADFGLRSGGFLGVFSVGVDLG